MTVKERSADIIQILKNKNFLGPTLGSLAVVAISSALLTRSVNECVQSQQQLDRYDKLMNSYKESLDGLGSDKSDDVASDIDKAFNACIKYCKQFKQKSAGYMAELRKAKEDHDKTLDGITSMAN